MIISLFLWNLTFLGSSLIGFTVLKKCVHSSQVCYFGGRLFGFLLVLIIPWWLAHAGFQSWLTLGIWIYAVSVVAAVFFLVKYRNEGGGLNIKQILKWESLWFGAFVLFFILRLDQQAIIHTEKFMDFGILNSLLLPQALPPEDFWLSGESLQYYYYGWMMFVIPIKLLQVDSGFAYNLVVSSLGSTIALLAYSIGRMLSGKVFIGMLVSFLCIFSGSLDGARQLGRIRSLESISLWDSTRLDPNVIMEFPFFSIWLGDVHSHLMSMPIVLLILAISTSNSDLNRLPRRVFMLSFVCGLLLCVNPWFAAPMFPLGLWLLLCNDHFRIFDVSRPSILVVGFLVLLGFGLTTIPFLLHYQPPIGGLRMVDIGTNFNHLMSYAGLFVLCCGIASIVAARSILTDQSNWVIALFVMVASITMALSERPVLVLSISLFVACGWLTVYSTEVGRKHAFSLAGAASLLFAIPELLYVEDAHGGEYVRLNTVFKFYFLAWILSAVAAFKIIPLCIQTGWIGQWTVSLALLFACIHPVSAVLTLDWKKTNEGPYSSIDPTDVAIVRYLRSQPVSGALVEAVGDSYGLHGRISSYSGVPAYLGWIEHQILWRGHGITPELKSREGLIRNLYTTKSEKIIRDTSLAAGIRWIVVGNLEHDTYPELNTKALRSVGDVVVDNGNTFLVMIE